MPGYAEAGDRFGSSLAAGDSSGGPACDLAIGVPFADDAAPDGGAVIVIYGSGQGLHPGGVQRWTQDTPGIGESAERGDRFGTTLAVGNLGHDGHDDLVVGVPHEGRHGRRDAGAVHVIYGAEPLLSATGSQVLTQDSPGLPESAEAGARFGAALATGNLGRSGYADLAVGVPGEDRRGRRDAGVAEVVYGSATGLRTSGSRLWSQDSRGVAGGRPGTGSAPASPRGTSAAATTPTSRSGCPARTSGGFGMPAPSTSSTERHPASRRPGTSCGPRTAAASPGERRPGTGSAPASRPGTSAAAAKPTSPSGFRPRTSAAGGMPGSSPALRFAAGPDPCG